MKDYITFDEAAKILDRSIPRIYQLIADRKLTKYKPILGKAKLKKSEVEQLLVPEKIKE